MKKKSKRLLLTVFLCFAICPSQAYASDGEKYVTISVDATDDNEAGLQYALDTDSPEAFTSSNEFTVPAGTEHTIYVKDAAGNITSQVYNPNPVQEQEETPPASVTVTDFSQEQQEDGQQINIDLEIDRKEPDYSDYEYLTDEPVEAGTGTVAEKIKTDGSESSDRIFYTITTKEGEALYLIVDQSRQSDNVYLLDTVSADDLLALADGAASAGNGKEEKEDNLFAALSKDSETAEDEKKGDDKEKSSSNSNLLIVLLFVLAGGGAYYYFKIYKNKKDEVMDVMDAMDIEDFEPEDLEEEADFEYDDREKEKYLAELIDDESLYDASPEEYVATDTDETDTGEYTEEYYDYGFDENEVEGDEL